MRTAPSRLARRLWARIQSRTLRLWCQAALSQTNKSALQPSAAKRSQTRAQEFFGDLAHRTALHEAQEHRVGVGPQQPVAAEGFGGRVVLLGGELLQPQGALGPTPGAQLRAGQPAPPGFIGKAQYPIRVTLGQAQQPRAGFFFRS
jgi:hypothetical protein